MNDESLKKYFFRALPVVARKSKQLSKGLEKGQKYIFPQTKKWPRAALPLLTMLACYDCNCFSNIQKHFYLLTHCFGKLSFGEILF
jgi:hypothetical protein